ncbi:MAG: hypothetical protein KDJ37_01390 [Hyphomicrobiaceae bacterium]|nr:hypothetical protein [Hyphomicrobiaceae bacterium]
MENPFVSIDVETANGSRASICQIGLVASDGVNEAWRWSSLVNPEEGFESRNVGIHKIQPEQVADAALFPDIIDLIKPSLEGQCLVSWTVFDQDAVYQASQKYGLSYPVCSWIDACDVARNVWPELPNHELETVATTLGIEFEHHDALADAWACSRIFETALQQTATSLAFWIQRFGERIPAPYGGPVDIRREEVCTFEGNRNGPLYGHVLLQTGTFEGGKSKLGRIAASLGCEVKNSWSKKITLLVVGARDSKNFGGVDKSGKHLKAIQAQSEGQPVSILTEPEFWEWVSQFNIQGHLLR